MKIAHKTTLFLLGFLGIALALATGTFLSVNEQNRQIDHTQDLIEIHSSFMNLHHNQQHGSDDAWNRSRLQVLENHTEVIKAAASSPYLNEKYPERMGIISDRVERIISAVETIRNRRNAGTSEPGSLDQELTTIGDAAQDGETQSMLLLQSMETSGISQVRWIYLMTGMLLLILFLNVFLGHHLFRRRISSPIEELTELINNISRGKIDVKIDNELKDRDDEIGRLARSFERTLASLKLAMERSAPLLEKKNKSLQDVIAEKEEIEQELEELIATLDTTLDTIEEGVLIVAPDGTILHTNERFQEMWRIPEELIETGDDERLIEHVTEQLQDPEEFKKRVQELYNNPKDGKSDMINFKDGRQFKRVFKTLKNDKTNIGWAWIFKDVSGTEGQADA